MCIFIECNSIWCMFYIQLRKNFLLSTVTDVSQKFKWKKNYGLRSTKIFQIGWCFLEKRDGKCTQIWYFLELLRKNSNSLTHLTQKFHLRATQQFSSFGLIIWLDYRVTLSQEFLNNIHFQVLTCYTNKAIGK